MSEKLILVKTECYLPHLLYALGLSFEPLHQPELFHTITIETHPEYRERKCLAQIFKWMFFVLIEY